MDTKEKLAEALRAKMKEKPLSRITISDLTTAVGINRQTFYYHYHDIYELIEDIYYRETMRAIGNDNTIETWQTGLAKLFHAVQNQKDFVEQTFRSISREHIEDFLYTIMENLIINAINVTSAGLLLKEEDKKLVADFYKHALIGMLLSWVKDGMRRNPDEIVAKIEILARDGFTPAISTFVKNRQQC